MTSVDSDAVRADDASALRPRGRERARVAQSTAAGIAHELRNPVFAIASAAQLLRYRVTDDPVVEKNIGRILREAERLNAFVTALLEYGRPSPARLSPADPDEVWTDVLATHRGALESKALLVDHTPASPRATCNVDAEQLATAFGNALANAIEAAPEGTDLSIVSEADASGWRSRLRNGGPTIPADTLQRAFEPLVTTKTGRTGIGLAVVERIVAEHGGHVGLATDEGLGTTLTFSLPLARAV
jgi:signal transduction histidine kinase